MLDTDLMTEDSAQPSAVTLTEPPAAGPTPVKTTPVDPATEEVSFYDLPLAPEVQNAALMAGYKTPSPIQQAIIPHMMDGRDVLAQSQTGTGKTAAFALPILSRIEIRGGAPQVLVLTPTRELAIQVSDAFETYAACQPGFRVATVYGGQGYDLQLRKLRQGVPVVVGTPGRVIDHIKRGTLDLSQVACLVLDEADEMLNMGFLDDVKFVLDQLPAQRQIALFSATMPGPIREVASKYLVDPARITIQSKTMTVDSVRQRALMVAPRDKTATLQRMLEAEETDGVIVFTKTKEATVTVAEKLARGGLKAVALNGDMPQPTRERTIERLKAGKLDVLVATDVAARGLDVKRVSHVFNYDLPHDTQSYIHRIGRTGRAGRKGEAIIFLTRNQRGQLKAIERVTRQPIEVVEPPSAKQINARRRVLFAQNIGQIIEDSAHPEAAMFQDLIQDFAESSGHSMDQIAAALAVLSQQGRPFLIKDFPKPAERDYDRESNRKEGKGDRKRRPERKTGPPAAGMTRYRIQVGWRDGVRPGNIVGAIANEAGIDGQNIGPIQINHGYSTIDLPSGMPAEVFRQLQRTWVVGRQMRISVDGEKPQRAERSSGKPAKHKSGKKHHPHLRSDQSQGQAAGKSSPKKKDFSAPGITTATQGKKKKKDRKLKAKHQSR